VGRQVGIVYLRKYAEARCPESIDSIYNELAKEQQWDIKFKERVKQLEIDTEIANCFPIEENIQKVKNGDYIVSDMYLPESTIQQILYKCGLRTTVKMHVSHNDKQTGRAWSILPKIDLHIGDNMESDIKIPERCGINTEYFKNSQYFSEYEKFVEDFSQRDLALLMRAVRLHNPYKPGSDEHLLWYEQSQLNIPVLILAALELPPDGLAFIHRDCVHLQKLHSALYSTKNNEFHCSRISLMSGGQDFKKYVIENAYGKKIVDLNGTGDSITKYWLTEFKEEPDLLYVSSHNLKENNRIIYSEFDIFERFNSSRLGSLLKYPNRDRCEFSETSLDAQHGAVECAIRLLSFFKFKRDTNLIKRLSTLMIHSSTPYIVKHVSAHGSHYCSVDYPKVLYFLSEKEAIKRVSNPDYELSNIFLKFPK